MNKIFVSYAHEDREKARTLAKFLEQQGLSVFWDRQVPTGDTWREYIGKSLEEAACVLVLWTAASVNSRWVVEEADEALKRSRLLPLLLEHVEPPLGFRAIQAADLTNWKPEKASAEMQRLLEDIRQLIESSADIGDQQHEIAVDSINRNKTEHAVNVGWPRGKKLAFGATFVLPIVLAGVMLVSFLRPSPVNRQVQPSEETETRSRNQPAPKALPTDNPSISVSMQHLNTDIEPLGQKAAMSLKSEGFSSFTIRDIRDQDSDYLVVIGSYKDASDAMRHLKRFRGALTKNIGLYYAINNYYALALGIYPNMNRANQERDRVKAIVPDAYIYPTSGIPLQIDIP